MILTVAQRQDLSRWADWRDLQIDYYNLSAYLHFTKLEDLDVVKATLALEDLSTRRSAFLVQWRARQEGAQAQHAGDAAEVSRDDA